MPKKKSRQDRLNEAVQLLQAGYDDINIIKDELENWKCNMEDNNMEHLPIYAVLEQATDDICDAISQIYEQITQLEAIEMPVPFKAV